MYFKYTRPEVERATGGCRTVVFFFLPEDRTIVVGENPGEVWTDEVDKHDPLSNRRVDSKKRRD